MPSRLANILPSRMKEYIRHVAAGGDIFAALLMQIFGTGVLCGSGLVTDPTAANAQVTGAGNTTWNVDVGHIIANFKGSLLELAKQISVSIHSGSQLVAAGQSCVAAVVVKNSAGTLSIVTVKGTPATTGSQVGPTDAAIQTAVGSSDWMKLAEVTLSRPSDLVVTAAYNHSKGDRGLFGVQYPY